MAGQQNHASSRTITVCKQQNYGSMQAAEAELWKHASHSLTPNTCYWIGTEVVTSVKIVECCFKHSCILLLEMQYETLLSRLL